MIVEFRLPGGGNAQPVRFRRHRGGGRGPGVIRQQGDDGNLGGDQERQDTGR